MIPACRDEISTCSAETDFTLRLDVEIKFRPGKAGQFCMDFLWIFLCKPFILQNWRFIDFHWFNFFYLSCLVFSCVYSFSQNKKQSFANVLQNRCSWKFRSIHRKTLALESLFNKIADLKAGKETPTQVLSCKYCKIFKNIFFAEHFQWLLL